MHLPSTGVSRPICCAELFNTTPFHIAVITATFRANDFRLLCYLLGGLLILGTLGHIWIKADSKFEYI